MRKRFWLVIVIIVLILTAGCGLIPSNVSQVTPEGISLDDMATLSAFATQANFTPAALPELPTFTFTPDTGGLVQPTVQQSVTPLPGNIKITSIIQKTPGVALITWEVTGDFPSGFKVVFTDQQTQPTFPENSSVSAGSSTARSALINYTADQIYYVRVCRFMFDTCDIYSDLGIFAFASPTQTPKPTNTPYPTKTAGAVVINGTVVPYDTTLEITLIKTAGDGKAYFEWTDKSTSSKGYKIVYSTSTQTPTLGVDSFFYVFDTNARSAYVDGNSGTLYYYRICRYNGTTCTGYSKMFSFTFPTFTSTAVGSVIDITSIINTTTGLGQIDWTATGTFPNGFKILYSKTNTLPTLSDNVVYVSDGAARVATFSGDPSSTYHVRMCKYSGTDCTVYSQLVDFKFDADPIVITLTGATNNISTPGYVDLTWSISGGTAPNGYKLLYSSNAEPTIDNSSVIFADSSATSGIITGAPGTHYYLRVCKFTGTTCSVYSNIMDINTP